jgi:tetratricopeptide (TPR) repeat protein
VSERLAEVAAAYRVKYPQHGEAQMALGSALLNLGRFEEAVPLLEGALNDPSNADNREQISFSLGLALSKRAEWARAARVLSQLLEENPAYAKAYHQLGLVLSRLGRAAQAEAMTAKARELAPSEREMRRETELRGAGDPGRAAAAKALALELRGDFAESEETLRAPDLKGSPAAVLALADLYLESLRPADAENVLQHAATLAAVAPADVIGRRARAAAVRGTATPRASP